VKRFLLVVAAIDKFYFILQGGSRAKRSKQAHAHKRQLSAGP